MITKTSLPNAPTELGVRLVKEEKILSGQVSEFYRRHVLARCGAPKAELIDWMKTQLIWEGAGREIAQEEAERIFDALVEVGDFGLGSAFGQSFAIPLAPRSVLLPDGSVAVLGACNEETRMPADAPNAIVRRMENISGDADGNLFSELGPPDFKNAAISGGIVPRFEDLASLEIKSGEDPEDIAKWAEFSSGRVGIRMTEQFPDPAILPKQLRRALYVCGVLHGNRWEIDQQTADFLTEWLGMTPRARSDQAREGIDPDQEAVIRSGADERIVTEAGPGSGKTFVACDRIANLIHQNVSPTKIWLLSFTRVAVEELRNRISQALVDPRVAQEINLATFDSFAGRMNSQFSAKENFFFEGYDKAISRAVSLLKSEDIAIDNFFGSLEHIVIDEAQDLVGNRRELVELVISKLPRQCGVTVLGDFAQAIYGFQERPGAPRSFSLSEKLEDSFVNRRLGTDHRTRNPVLANLFSAARLILRDKAKAPEAKYHEVRSLIEESATAAIKGPMDPRFSLAGSPMVLFRSRNALLSAGNEMLSRGVSCRIKISDRGNIVAPWIGSLFAGLPWSTKLRRDDFHFLWEDLSPEPFEPDEEEAWVLLSRIANGTGKFISISELCSGLEYSIPVSLLKDHIGTQGPLFSTIHGAKGREADRVLLMLPRSPSADPARDIDWEEEARILYVGATRARSELLIGSRRSGYFRRLPDGRLWRSRGAGFSVEAGLMNDQEMLPVSDNTEIDKNIRQVAHTIWSLGDSPIEAEARRNGRTGKYEIFIPSIPSSNEIPFANLSMGLINDLCVIAGVSEEKLPPVLGGFSMIGGSTVVMSQKNSDDKTAGIALAPILTGFIQLTT